MSVRAILWVSLLLSAIPGVCPAVSATVGGRVTDTSGEAVPGALVTLFSGDKLYSETVYTDLSGLYKINTSLSGNVRLRARSPMFGDILVDVNLNDEITLKQDMTLMTSGSQQAISESFPANAYLSKLRFKDKDERAGFISHCTVNGH